MRLYVVQIDCPFRNFILLFVSYNRYPVHVHNFMYVTVPNRFQNIQYRFSSRVSSIIFTRSNVYIISIILIRSFFKESSKLNYKTFDFNSGIIFITFTCYIYGVSLTFMQIYMKNYNTHTVFVRYWRVSVLMKISL